MTTGDRIRTRREEIGMSVDELAAALGKNRATIYRYENGYIDDIPLSVVKKMASVLAISPRILMDWEDEEKETPEQESPRVSVEDFEKIHDLSDRVVRFLIEAGVITKRDDLTKDDARFIKGLLIALLAYFGRSSEIESTAG